MAITLMNMGPEDDTPEYLYAKQLYDLFLEKWKVPESAGDTSKSVTIIAGANILGGIVLERDVDILVIYDSSRKGAIHVPALRGGHKIRVLSFIVAIELKCHSGGNFRISEAGNLEVRYKEKWESPINQNNNQILAIRAFTQLFPQLAHGGHYPWIDGVIWLPNASPDQIDALHVPHNLMGSNATLERLIQRISGNEARFPKNRRNNQTQTWDLMSSDDNTVHKNLTNIICAYRSGTELDKRKMDALLEGVDDAAGAGGLLIYSGYGGSGKTFGLLRAAIRAYQHDKDRVLLLTFNRMLVYELRRVLSQAGVKSINAGGPRVQVESITAWIQRLAHQFGILPADKNVIGLGAGEFATLCDQLANRIHGISDGQPCPEASKLLDFDLACIDEAQDVPLHEKKVIEAAFAKKRIQVADGIDQIVRIGGHAVSWRRNREDNNEVVRLDRCYRLKRNLVQFANGMAGKLGMPGTWRLRQESQALGGNVIICLGRTRHSLKRMLQRHMAANNEQQIQIELGDMLICVSAHLLHGGDNRDTNAIARDLDELGIPYWNGTSPDVLNLPPMESSKVRLVSLDQCRGLEGWKVALVGLDRFYERKFQEAENEAARERAGAAHDDAAQMDVGVMARISAAQWIMMILTRPIDTLIIHVEDEHSPFARTLLDVATNLGRDYISIER